MIFGWRVWAIAVTLSLAAHTLFAAVFLSRDEETMVAGGAEVGVLVLGDAFADAVMRREPADELDLSGEEATEEIAERVETETALSVPESMKTASENHEHAERVPIQGAEALQPLIGQPQAPSYAALHLEPLPSTLAAVPLPEPTASPESLSTPSPPSEQISPVRPRDSGLAAERRPDNLPESIRQTALLQPVTKPVPSAEPETTIAPLVETEIEEPETLTVPTARPVERRATKPAYTENNALGRQKPTEKKQHHRKKASAKPSRRLDGNGGNTNRNARAGTPEGRTRKAAKNAGRKRSQKRAAGNANISNYKGKLRSRIMRRFRPRRVQARRDVLIRFVVARNGQLRSASIVRSSGNSRLDRAALQAVRSASPFPAFPVGYGRSTLIVTVPMAVRS